MRNYRAKSCIYFNELGTFSIYICFNFKNQSADKPVFKNCLQGFTHALTAEVKKFCPFMSTRSKKFTGMHTCQDYIFFAGTRTCVNKFDILLNFEKKH